MGVFNKNPVPGAAVKTKLVLGWGGGRAMTLKVWLWRGWNLLQSDLDGTGQTQPGMALVCSAYELWDLGQVISAAGT